MGTTGTIVGTSKSLKEKNPSIKIIGVQPEEGSQIPGIRKWPKEYLPKIFNDQNITPNAKSKFFFSTIFFID